MLTKHVVNTPFERDSIVIAIETFLNFVKTRYPLSFELESSHSNEIFNLSIPALNFHQLNPKLKPYNSICTF